MPQLSSFFGCYVLGPTFGSLEEFGSALINTNGEIIQSNIINFFGYILKDNIFKWGKNYVQEHPNCIFEELEQAFCK